VQQVLALLRELREVGHSDEILKRRATEVADLINLRLKAAIRAELANSGNLPLTAEFREEDDTIYARFITSDTWVAVLSSNDRAIIVEALKRLRPGMAAEEVEEVIRPLRRGQIDF
jgi:hypothetical protein